MSLYLGCRALWLGTPPQPSSRSGGRREQASPSCHATSPLRVLGLLRGGPSPPAVPSDGWLGGTGPAGGTAGGTERGQSAPPFAAALVSCRASVLGWLQSFPDQRLAGACRRTYREGRLRLYLATQSIASGHAASIFFQDISLRGNKITSLLLRLTQHGIFSLLPTYRIACYQHLSTPLLLSAYSGGHVLSQVFWLQNIVRLYAWLWCYPALVADVSLSEEQSRFDTAPFCTIDKSSLSHGSWMDDENVDSPRDPTQSINALQERMKAEGTARQRERN